MTDPRPKANKYEGGNETIDRLLAEHWPSDTLWFINGPYGRKPITADTEEEAREIYAERFKPHDKDDLLLSTA